MVIDQQEVTQVVSFDARLATFGRKPAHGRSTDRRVVKETVLGVVE
jgi:hypothetical protein